LASPLLAAVREDKLSAAADALARAVAAGQVDAAAFYVRQGMSEFSRTFGTADSPDDMFLLASITKPMSSAALMTLYDDGEFQLDDPAKKFIPEFAGDGRETITVRQLLTHVSGLPDQLPENAELRRSHAGLPEFVERAIRTPLLFEPGTRYSYSSMAILLASEIAQRITGANFLEFIDRVVFRRLAMNRSALGLGGFQLEEMVRCQTEDAAPESGAGDPTASQWDWNSPYWRRLGSPWGGAHGSAADAAKFFGEFLRPSGKLVKPETARLMVENHNREGLHPRGLGFDLGRRAASPRCSEQAFGHTGSTGTLAWADPATDTICVILTTLPAAAVSPHPRRLASDLVAEAVG
jgi:CubicO group peptidase (beta-lactamase class C family)